MTSMRFAAVALLALLLWLGFTHMRENRAREAQDVAEQAQPQAPAAAAEPAFLRFVERPAEGSAALETVIAAYADDAGRRVDLVAAVHVGDTAYYELLNRVFRAYDSVLYELVKPKDAPVPTRASNDSSVSTVQRQLKDLLALDFQLDAIDYTAPNFVHADLDPETFFRLMDEKGESLWTLMLQAMLNEWQAGTNDEDLQAMPYALLLAMLSKDRARDIKYVLGRQFDDLERMAAGLEKGLGGQDSVLVVDRNKAALAVLRERLDAGDRKLAIYYGAAHLPDMERRMLREFGLRRTHETWITAWDIEMPRSPEPPAPPATPTAPKRDG